MKVSVIVAARDAETTIRRAIQSVLAQTLVDLELLIVDDGSRDSTAAVCNQFVETDHRVKLFSHSKCLGVAAARNTALSSACGEWIAVLDADDWYEVSRLQSLVSSSESRSLDIIFDNIKLVSAEEQSFISDAFPAQWFVGVELLPPTFIVQHDIPFQQSFGLGYCKPLFRRLFLEKCNLRYDQRFRVAEDLLLLESALLQGGRCGYINESLYNYAVSSHSSSHKARANRDISRANHALLSLAQNIGVMDSKPLLSFRQKVIDYTSLASALRRKQMFNILYFARALGPFFLATQLVRLSAKSFGITSSIPDPRARPTKDPTASHSETRFSC